MSRRTTTRRSTINGEWAKPDEEILAEFQATGNSKVLEELIARYEKDLYGYLYRYLGDSQLAEDVFQSTFLQIYLKSDQFDAERKFRPWLYTVATNQAIDAQRRNKRHHYASLQKNVRTSEDMEGVSLLDVLPGEELTPEDMAIVKERAERVNEFVGKLPEHLQQVVQLIYFEGLKYREAADILELPVGTVKSRLHTAMKRLAEWMYAENYEP